MAHDVEQLIHKHKRMVYWVARRHFPSCRADPDLLQCGLIGLWRAAQSWDQDKPFAPYAAVCIKNAMRNHLRQVSRWETPIAPEDIPPMAAAATEERTAARLDLQESIEAAFPPNSRERYILTALSTGVSKGAVAAALGLDTHQVTKLAKRAFDALKKGEAD